MSPRIDDLPELRKSRGAFFTPPAIADFLASWAVDGSPDSTVLDPTCGEAVFLLAAGRELRRHGCAPEDLDKRVYGVDLHEQSLDDAKALLEHEGLDGTLLADDFFNVPTPSQLGCPLPPVDAVVGNPPFVRYQDHSGDARKRSQRAALAQGVRLSGMASSWAALLVHACGFLKPEGRLAMVLPAELLTVHYAEPVRRWLKQRFAAVDLVMFEQLQFTDALENVVLVVAKGSGGCDSFSLHYASDGSDLQKLGPFDHYTVTPAHEGKWTDMLLSNAARQIFKSVATDRFVPLRDYGKPELGSVTGANHFFALDEATRTRYRLTERQVRPICPPGTKHLRGFSFDSDDWKRLKAEGQQVWLLDPDPADATKSLERYLAEGERREVPAAYKCRIRTPWWKPPVVAAPDLYFTYMSHRYPRLVTNQAGLPFLNSMHGIRLDDSAPRVAKVALPILAMNSATLLGAEVFGRSYGGGVLKMEPTEAASLPVPAPEDLGLAWEHLRRSKRALERHLARGDWEKVVTNVDSALLDRTMGLGQDEIFELRRATDQLRERRIR